MVGNDKRRIGLAAQIALDRGLRRLERHAGVHRRSDGELVKKPAVNTND
jgi:hypothetical protein